MKKYLISACAVLALSAGVVFAAPDPFPRGLNNLPDGHWVRGRGDAITMPFPARDNMFFDDFCQFDEATGVDWTITQVEAGAGDAAEIVADADDCILEQTTDANEDDNSWIQQIGEGFTFTSGKEAYFEMRLKIGDATQSDFLVGLHVRDTSPIASAPADGVYFRKDDGDALLDFTSRSASVNTESLGIHTVVDDTYVKIAFYYDGGTSFAVAVNDAVVTTLTATPTTTELALSFGAQAGSAAADVLSTDYIFFWKER